MPTEGSVFDGFTSIIAQDADTHPSYLPESMVSESVNRTFRGGINRTRPSIRNIEIVAGSGQSETIVNDILGGSFQGSYPYRATKYESADGLLMSVSGVIYFLKIVNNLAYAYKLGTADGWTWNDPGQMHTWFVQAEDWVYIQNGFNLPIAWNGDLTSNAFRLNPYQKEMPIGTIMEYAFGRVFVSDKVNNIYASDIIYGNGFTDTTNTRNFTEITYWAEGGAFSTPSMMGNITGMKVMPQIGANLRGQGELVILTGNGAFSMDVSIPRSQWNTSNIQRISLLGRGCTSPYLALANSELWFRSHDGWAFYSNSQSEFARYFSLRKLSREVNKWVQNDTPWLKQFASTIFFNNYLISTVAPQTYRAEGVEGLNRYHRGMVVLDLDQSSSPSPDAQLSFRWNGIWTGFRPTQLLTALIQGEKRGFGFSFDPDNKNRLYEFTTTQGDDYGPNGNRQIKSFFTTGRYDFNRSGATNKFLRKKITGGEMWMSEIKGIVDSKAEFRADSNPCWSELKIETTYGCDPCSPKVTECFPQQGGNRYKRYKFNTPDPSECNDLAGIPSVEGSEFQIKVNLTGAATIDRVRLMANIKNNDDSPVGDCPEENQECEPFLCCQEKYWEYNIVNK
jgi:hypothetical protein